MAKRKKYDWEAIEREYRAGMLSIREISRRQRCPESTIRARAKKSGWDRDLSEKVRKRAQQKLLRRKLRTPTATDEEIIEQASDTAADIQEFHRKDIGGGRAFVELFYDQLRLAATNREDLEEANVEETAIGGKDDGPDFKRRAQMLKAISLPAHVGVLRDLSVALKNLVPLERQAYNLNEDDDPLKNLGKGIGEGIAKASVEEASRIYAERLKG